MASACALVWLAVLSVYDIRERRLPNWLTMPGAAVIIVMAAMHGRGGPAVLGAVALFAVYAVVHLVSPAAMGAGDAKLAIGRVLRRYIEHPGQGAWHVSRRDDGRFVGWVSLKFAGESPDIEVGYRLISDAWGSGFAGSPPHPRRRPLLRNFAKRRRKLVRRLDETDHLPLSTAQQLL